MELLDLLAVGRKFTWFNTSGTSMSRLDRFLLSESLIRIWNLNAQYVGDKTFSDHCPIFLKTIDLNWGPKPFKFFSAWLKYEDFFPFVEKAWKSYRVSGRNMFIFKEKLKLLKTDLKVWNKQIFGILDLKVSDAVKEINDQDMVIEADDY
ncbi:unnamed protein product [Lathyrus sativus]|nr:unnamed protein product [Lathyrus sativus]